MNLLWSILDAKPSSEYEILFASKTSSLLQEYFDEIVLDISEIKPKSNFRFSTKRFIVIFLENKFQ